MRFASLPERPFVRPSAPAQRRGVVWDLIALAVLLLLFWAAVVWRYQATPLQLWDESRNANNALELALVGPPSWRWLVPTFGGVADHWNTKPPLLIWLMAAGLRAGMPPLLAVRLPSWTAAFTTVVAVWSVLRFGLADRLAAFVGGALVLSSTLYVGGHAARTGDFDALETAFVTIYVFCGWAALRDPSPLTPRTGWVAATAVCAALAVFAKGVAGLLAAPGLLLFAFARPRATLGLLRDAKVWAAGAAMLVVCGGYYLLRERIDPGYGAAVLANEVGGRFMTVSDHHQGGANFYFNVLAATFEPGMGLLVTAILPLAGRERRRSGLVMATGLSGLAMLLVLSAARSKLDWYAMPIVPLFATAAAVGASDLARWMRRLGLSGRILDGAIVIGLTGACVMTAVANQSARTTSHGDLDAPQLRYAAILDRIEVTRAASEVIAVDSGFANAAGFRNYNPVLQFYARRESARGLPVRVRAPGAGLPPGSDVVSCDPAAEEILRDTYRFTVTLQVRGCVLIRLAPRAA